VNKIVLGYHYVSLTLHQKAVKKKLEETRDFVQVEGVSLVYILFASTVWDRLKKKDYGRVKKPKPL
jgi:hypothetical protein